MAVAMVQVGVMRMRMLEASMPMPMRMRFPFIRARLVLMLVVRVMYVQVAVLHRFVDVGVLVALADMQPDTQRHQHGGSPEEDRRLISEQRQREHRAEEGRYRKVRAGSGRSPDAEALLRTARG